jgi:N-acetylmuramic acid 6-phosphate etherase
MGAGTSGRLGVLDAAECPSTFSVPADMVVGLIAGGADAFSKATEGAEDDAAAGVSALKDIALTRKDIVVGITVSGRTPYVVGGLTYARTVGAMTVALSCNRDAALHADHSNAPCLSQGGEVPTWVSSRRKNPWRPGQLSVEINILSSIRTGLYVRTVLMMAPHVSTAHRAPVRCDAVCKSLLTH